MTATESTLFAALPTLGFGGVAGVVVGYAAKKLSKLLALFLGVTFILLQMLSYFGLITVNWGAMEAIARPVLESPSLHEQAWEVLTGNLPFAGGFGVGFAIGFKLG